MSSTQYPAIIEILEVKAASRISFCRTGVLQVGRPKILLSCLTCSETSVSSRCAFSCICFTVTRISDYQQLTSTEEHRAGEEM